MRSLSTALLVTVATLQTGCHDPAQQDIAKGNVLRNRGEVDEALERYEMALEAAPGHRGVLEKIAETLSDAKRPDAAVKAWERVLSVDPDSEAALLGLARMATERGDLEVARGHLTAILEENPRHNYALMSRANLQTRAGNAEAAIEDYGRAVAMDQNNRSALYGYGGALLDANDATRAREAFDKLERMAPDSPLGAYGLATFAAHEGRLDDALRFLRESARRARLAGTNMVAEQVEGDRRLRPLATNAGFAAFLAQLRAASTPKPTSP